MKTADLESAWHPEQFAERKMSGTDVITESNIAVGSYVTIAGLNHSIPPTNSAENGMKKS